VREAAERADEALLLLCGGFSPASARPRLSNSPHNDGADTLDGFARGGC